MWILLAIKILSNLAINWWSNGYITVYYTSTSLQKKTVVKILMSEKIVENDSKELTESEKWAIVAIVSIEIFITINS